MMRLGGAKYANYYAQQPTVLPAIDIALSKPGNMTTTNTTSTSCPYCGNAQGTCGCHQRFGFPGFGMGGMFGGMMNGFGLGGFNMGGLGGLGALGGMGGLFLNQQS